ncbi:MAG: leucyl/phenylalanyl-tRNA--protein transferase [Gemmataceae bacterium]|nr:leucyl/phenylalanyl-tRNA--protein transferase [Gemmataceae bacterium]
MRMGWVFDAESADEQGLVGIGADLEPETILAAYASGVFPTRFEPYCDPEWPMFWWSPDPRAIIELDGFHISRRLARTIRSGRFRVTINVDFGGVMLGCADREEGTWITHDVVAAYTRLFELGHAHSVEVWQDAQLVGGTYGLAIGGLFAAESKFHRVSDASKIALAALVGRLKQRGFRLLDIQMVTPHTASLGAIEIPRSDYLRRLSEALADTPTFVDA